MNKNLTTILWTIGIIVMVNLLSRQFFFRFDTTKDKTYTLSKATKDILSDLDEPITVSAYFTSSLPPQYSKTIADFRDLLTEYSTRSRGMVNYEFFDPNEDPMVEQEAVQNGIQPLLINVREKDEVVQKKAFMGAILTLGESREIMPFVAPGGPMEYELTTSIKKLSIADKPTIGFVSGHGEPPVAQLGQVYNALSVLYGVESVDLSEDIPTRHRVVILLNPIDSLTNDEFEKLDNYLENGGKLCIAYNSVTGNFQTVQGEAINTGVGTWLNTKGINIPASFVLDASCSSIGVQQRQGFFNITSQVQFPYFPLVNKFEEHPITQGLDQIGFQFVSPVEFTPQGDLSFTPIVKSSENSAIQPLPVFFDVQRRWTDTDFPVGSVTIAGVVEGDFGGNGVTSQMVIFSDGDFPMGQGGGGSNADNFSLLVNSIDWLADDTGLIDLRTKGVVSRPIEELEDGRKSFLKWLNFGLPLALVAALGMVRHQQRRNIRMKRMSERYV